LNEDQALGFNQQQEDKSSFSSFFNAHPDTLNPREGQGCRREVTPMTEDEKRKYIKRLIVHEIKCSVCFHMFVKPITLVCGHT
jgi:hypothetical protein